MSQLFNSDSSCKTKETNFDSLEYEKERLKEIYGLLYPNDRVLLMIATDDEFSRPVSIRYQDPHQFLRVCRSNYVNLELGVDKFPVPTKIFRLTFNCRNEPLVRGGARQPLRRRVVNQIRQVISHRAPLVYEWIKERYLKRRDRCSHSYDRLLNLENPKNQPGSLRKQHINEGKAALVCMHWLDVGGAEAFAVDSCRLYREKAYETIILSAHNGRRHYFEKLASFHTVYEVDRQIPVGEESRFICALIKQRGISVVHNHHNDHFYESLPSLRVLAPKIKVIDSLHIDEKNRYGGGFPRISIVWANYIDYHHVISRRLMQLLKVNGVHSQNVIMGHLGKGLIPPANFSIIDSLALKKLRLCFVGRMSGQKRPLLVLAMLAWAVKEGRRKGVDVSVDMVGDGPYLGALESCLKHTGVRSAFVLHNAGANVEELMERSDMLVLGSENEGITLVAYEAFRNGCLVVSTNVGAQSELVPDEMLLSADVVGAYKEWKRLYRRILGDMNFVQQAKANFIRKAQAIRSAPSAEEAIIKLLD